MDARYRKYLLSKKWKQKKEELFKLRGKKCERCGEGGYIHVHHLTYANIYNERLEDLEILCNKCHAIEHETTKETVEIEMDDNKITFTFGSYRQADSFINELRKKRILNTNYDYSKHKKRVIEYQKSLQQKLKKVS